MGISRLVARLSQTFVCRHALQFTTALLHSLREPTNDTAAATVLAMSSATRMSPTLQTIWGLLRAACGVPKQVSFNSTHQRYINVLYNSLFVLFFVFVFHKQLARDVAFGIDRAYV